MKLQYPIVYQEEGKGRKKIYGLRNLSVHHETVDIKSQGSPGGYGTAMYGSRRYGAPAGPAS